MTSRHPRETNSSPSSAFSPSPSADSRGNDPIDSTSSRAQAHQGRQHQRPARPDETQSAQFQHSLLTATTTTNGAGDSVSVSQTSSPLATPTSSASSPSAAAAPSTISASAGPSAAAPTTSAPNLAPPDLAASSPRVPVSSSSFSPAASRPGAAGTGRTVPRKASRDDVDIELENMAPLGHHRRRSSLMNPIFGGSRAGASAAGSGGQEEPKIPEEERRRDRRRRGSGNGDGEVSDEDLHDDEETGLTGKQKMRKRDIRRRNTQLDQRIVRGGGGGGGGHGVIGGPFTDAEKKEADKNVARRLAINASLIGLWYLFSLSISIYNKWMFDSKQLDFPFPLFTTAIHMLIQFSLACLILYLFPSLRPYNSQSHRSDLGQSRHEAEPPEQQRGRTAMTKMFYLTRIGPCGAATGLDIGLGNTSLKYITLTFYTMCKSSALGFVLLFAFLFRLEQPTWRLVAIIATMTIGVLMMVAGEIEFKLGGFLLVISAAFFSGFRWGLTQILLLRNPATSNPFSSIFYLAPIMFLTLFTLAVFVEGLPELMAGIAVLAEAKGAVAAPVIVLFPGTIAFLMTASEFALLQRTSVVTLSIAGIFKEVVTILAAALVFGDKLTPINASGLVVTLGAICAYNYIKITKMREEARAKAHSAHALDYVAAESASGSSASGSGSDDENDADADVPEDAALLRRGDSNAVDGDGFTKSEASTVPGGGAGGGGGGPRAGERLRDG